MTPLALVLALCLPLQSGQDTIECKDGRVLKGRILSETEKEVVIEKIFLGSKGQVIGTAKVPLLKAQIKEIRRGSDEARSEQEQRASTFGARSIRRFELLSALNPEKVEFEGRSGLRVEGTHFEIYSTCRETFLKEVAVALEEVFSAYRTYFEIRRNSDRKIRVYLLRDRGEYEGFQLRKFGGAVKNPAFYHSRDNYIAAFNMIEAADERKLRLEIRRDQRIINSFKLRVQSEDRRIRQLAKQRRDEINAAANKAESSILEDRQANKKDRLAEVQRLRKALLERLDEELKALRKAFAGLEAEADKATRASEKAIAHNQKVLRLQNREMFEMLYHEGFHAFANNYLWQRSEKREVPRWLNEGMASYFEMSAVEGGALLTGASHPGFLRLCQGKSVSRTLIPLDELLAAGPREFMVTHLTQARRSGLYYAQSWALAHFVASRASREAINRYVEEVVGGADPVEAFARLAGKPWREVQTELQAYVRKLK